MTFSEMITNVGYLINQDLSGDTKLVTRTEVKANLNRAYHKVYNKVTSLGQGYGLRETYTDLVSAQSRYGFPDDFMKFDRLEIGYTTEDTRVLAQVINRDAINDPQQSISSATPVVALLGNMYQIFPTPTTTVSNGLHLWYMENVVDLVDDTDEPVLPNGYEDLLIEYAAGQAKRRQGLMDEAREMIQDFMLALETMTDEVVDRVDEGGSVVIRDVY